MIKRLYIADCLLLSEDSESYWLEVQMPDGSCAAISLDSHGPLTNRVFTAWAKQTIQNLEDAFVALATKQFEGESDDAKDYGAGTEETNSQEISTKTRGDSETRGS